VYGTAIFSISHIRLSPLDQKRAFNLVINFLQLIADLLSLSPSQDGDKKLTGWLST
jgi:hypothetical protein